MDRRSLFSLQMSLGNLVRVEPLVIVISRGVTVSLTLNRSVTHAPLCPPAGHGITHKWVKLSEQCPFALHSSHRFRD